MATYRAAFVTEEMLLTVGLATVAAAAQLFLVKRARSHRSDHLTPAALFAAFLLVPRSLLIVVIVVAFVPEWIVYRRKWFIQTFNISSWLIAVTAGKIVLEAMTQHFRLERATLPLPASAILVSAPLVLGVQTLLLAGALKLARGTSLRDSGLFAPGKLFVELALLCAGWGFATAWVVDPIYGIAAGLPMALIFQALHVPNLREEAATDPKTGLSNMRHFNAAFVRHLDQAQRSGQPLSLLMADLDYLRNINNTHGHQAGDIVLSGVADTLRRAARQGDVVGRFGGEEFVVLLRQADKEAAHAIAERLRSEVEASRYEIAPGRTIGATISIGVAALPECGRTLEALTREADLAVYQAKRDGRNRVVVAGRGSRELAGEWAREHLMPAGPPNGDSEGKGAGRPRWEFLDRATRTSMTEEDRPAVTAAAQAATAGPDEGVKRPSGQVECVTPPREGAGVMAFVACLCAVALLGLLAEWAGPLQSMMASRTTISLPGLGIFAALTVLAQQVAIDTGDRRGKISVTVVMITAATFLYGALGGLVTAASFAVWAKMRSRSPLYRMVFNFASALLAAEGAAWTFHALSPRSVLDMPFSSMLPTAALAGLVYYALNHASLCVVRGVSEGVAPWRLWWRQYAWLAPYYAVFGGLALVVSAVSAAFGWAGVLAAMAPVAMMQAAMKRHMDSTRARYEDLQRFNARLSDSFEATLQALTRALDTRDEETEEHSQRVRRYAEVLARALGLSEAEVERIGHGALLHDIGKIGVPDAILLKPGPLTEDEQAAMRRHPSIGYAMITHIPNLGPAAADVVLHHHEAYDGSGYPSGLKGDAIPLGARIFAVADALDAMTADRPYRSALHWDAALAEIQRCRGVQFAPEVVDALRGIDPHELREAAGFPPVRNNRVRDGLLPEAGYVRRLAPVFSAA
ncbi:MAG TPA: diguanylate cyclase [Chloroflexota bacterium]|nr:diguanylate cyclase [Chloroflexota bacterium]